MTDYNLAGFERDEEGHWIYDSGTVVGPPATLALDGYEAAVRLLERWKDAKLTKESDIHLWWATNALLFPLRAEPPNVLSAAEIDALNTPEVLPELHGEKAFPGDGDIRALAAAVRKLQEASPEQIAEGKIRAQELREIFLKGE